MNFLQSWDIEKVAGQASKLVEQLDEYPSEHRPRAMGPRAGRAVSVHQSSSALKAWDELDFEAKKLEWAELCEQLKGLDTSNAPSPKIWQQRAKDAEYQLLRLCNMLLGLPDPLPFLASNATLSSKIAEVEARNRELQAAADAAAADTTEIITLVEQHRALSAAHQKLEDSMATKEAELVQARAASAEAASIRADAEVQAEEMQRLQETLRALRLEYERTQSSLFEITNNQEQVLGSRQREMELASEELERTQQRAAELALERDALVLRLEAAQEELETLADAAVEGAELGGQQGRGGEVKVGKGSGSEEGAPIGSHGLQRPDQQRHYQMRKGLGTGGGSAGKRGDGEGFWERQVRVKGEQVASLQAQLAQQQAATAEATSQLEIQAQSWSNRLAAAELTISKLEAELNKRPEPHVYQELVSQVTALQQLVDVQMDVEGWGQSSVREAVATLGLSPNTSHTVSNIQQERNRKLASDVANLKRDLESQSSALAAAQREVNALEAKANAATTLADRLEGDLAAVRHGQSIAGLLPALSSSHVAPPQHTQPHKADCQPMSLGQDSQMHVVHGKKPIAGAVPAAMGAQSGSGVRWPSGVSDSSGGVEEQQGPTSSSTATVQGPATPDSNDPNSTSSLLDIVISQRDRFRQRMCQLEEEKSTLGEQLAQARQQLDVCRADNIGLYEKVRYIEQYSQKGSGVSGGGKGVLGGKLQVVRVDGAGVPLDSEASAERAGARYQCGPLAFEINGGSNLGGGGGSDGSRGGTGGGGLSTVGVRARAAGPRNVRGFCFPSDEPQVDEESGGAEARYARAYEARVNPFTDFQKNEMEARVRSLQLHDRAMLAGSKLLVGNRFARAFVAAYAVLLHLFIMALLYFAMLGPSKHVVEMVDMGVVTQQQQAAGDGSSVV